MALTGNTDPAQCFNISVNVHGKESEECVANVTGDKSTTFITTLKALSRKRLPDYTALGNDVHMHMIWSTLLILGKCKEVQEVRKENKIQRFKGKYNQNKDYNQCRQYQGMVVGHVKYGTEVQITPCYALRVVTGCTKDAIVSNEQSK